MTMRETDRDLTDEELLDALGERLCEEVANDVLGDHSGPSSRLESLYDETRRRMEGPEWVSVEKDGPPSHEDAVLVWIESRHAPYRTLAHFMHEGGWWDVFLHEGSRRIPDGDEVTHYRPLPPPPQTDEDDE